MEADGYEWLDSSFPDPDELQKARERLRALGCVIWDDPTLASDRIMSEAERMTELVKSLEAAGRHDEAQEVTTLAELVVGDRLRPLTQVRELAHQRGDLQGEAVALLVHAKALIGLKRLAQAVITIDEAERIVDRVLATVSQEHDDTPWPWPLIVGPVMLRVLARGLEAVGRDESAARVQEATHAGQLMADAAIDEALRVAANARESGDHAGEAQATSMLARAFHEAGRSAEAEVCHERKPIPRVVGDVKVVNASLPRFGVLFDIGLDDRQDWQVAPTSDYKAIGYSFEDARGEDPGLYMRADQPEVVVLAGYVVVKTIGPFLEAFAKKLGDKFGETLGKALLRLRLLIDRRTKQRELDILLPGKVRITLVLPDPLTDDAILALLYLLDLDVTSFQRARFHWDESKGIWSSADRAITDPPNTRSFLDGV